MLPLSDTLFAHPMVWGTLVLLLSIVLFCCYRVSRQRLHRQLHDTTTAQAQYRMILDQMPAIVWTVDSRLIFTSISGAGMEGLGATAEKMVGKTIYQYFQTSDRNFKPIAAHEDAVRLGKSDTYDVTWLDHTYHVRLEPARDNAGQMMAVGVALDITPRVVAEKALAASEARNRALLTAIPDVMFRLDRTGQILQFIDHLTAPANVIGSHVSSLFPPQVTHQFLSAAQAALQTGNVQTFDYQTGTDHKLHYFEARLVSCGHDEVLVIVRNITHRKREELDLRQSQLELKALLDALPDHILQVRRDGRIAGIFAPRGRMHLPADQVIGKRVIDFLHSDQAPHIETQMQEVFDTGEEQSHTVTVELNGQFHSYESRIVRDPSNADQLIMLVRELSTPPTDPN